MQQHNSWFCAVAGNETCVLICKYAGNRSFGKRNLCWKSIFGLNTLYSGVRDSIVGVATCCGHDGPRF